MAVRELAVLCEPKRPDRDLAKTISLDRRSYCSGFSAASSTASHNPTDEMAGHLQGGGEPFSLGFISFAVFADRRR